MNTNARLGEGEEAKMEENSQHHRPILDAMSYGLQHWVDWLLWAGANITNRL
jgi:hypothetical protein